jgi:hypothetical protein
MLCLSNNVFMPNFKTIGLSVGKFQKIRFLLILQYFFKIFRAPRFFLKKPWNRCLIIFHDLHFAIWIGMKILNSGNTAVQNCSKNHVFSRFLATLLAKLGH